jgi:hypothetical protein
MAGTARLVLGAPEGRPMGLLRPDAHIDNPYGAPLVLLDEAALDTDWKSDVIQLSTLMSMGVHIERGATLEGTLVLLAGNVNDESKLRAAEDVEFAAIDGLAGGQFKDLYNLDAEFYQFSFTRTAGPGSLWIAAKFKR